MDIKELRPFFLSGAGQTSPIAEPEPEIRSDGENAPHSSAASTADTENVAVGHGGWGCLFLNWWWGWCLFEKKSSCASMTFAVLVNTWWGEFYHSPPPRKVAVLFLTPESLRFSCHCRSPNQLSTNVSGLPLAPTTPSVKNSDGKLKVLLIGWYMQPSLY